MRGTNGPYTNGLRFTGISVDTNGDYRLDFAWETNGDVQVFCRAMHYECWTNFGVVSTNDENQVVTNDVVNWRQVPGEKFMGIPDYWESLGVTTVTNGEGSFTDTNHANPLFDRVRFYAAAQYADSSVVRVYPEDCPEDGTPIPAFSAPLQGFKGTNVWLEGVPTTNIFILVPDCISIWNVAPQCPTTDNRCKPVFVRMKRDNR